MNHRYRHLIDTREYRELAGEPVSMMRLLAQDETEWFAFLEFMADYFFKALVYVPRVVVEIGVMKNAQKVFYEKLLGADHIGIDMNPNSGADIIGDSHKRSTKLDLEFYLKGRPIDLLFIDGDHSYEAVKQDYEMYGPLTRHVIALHDIDATVNSEVKKFWQEISHTGPHLSMAIRRKNDRASITENKFVDMGIGLIIKRRTK